MRRAKTERINDVELPLPKVTGQHRELYDVLIGKRSEKGICNASGALIGDGSALLRVASDWQYWLVLAVGSELYLAGKVRACDPCIRAIGERMTIFGPSPAERKRTRLATELGRMTDDELHKAEVRLRRSWGLRVVSVKGARYQQPKPNRLIV